MQVTRNNSRRFRKVERHDLVSGSFIYRDGGHLSCEWSVFWLMRCQCGMGKLASA